MPYARSAGAQIYWEETGAGPPLLLIQGLGYSARLWYRVAPALAARHRVISFDNRGVGRSEVPPGPYPVAAMADDALAVLAAAGLERAHVLGVSLGGMVAQELALRHPRAVRALILGCTSFGGVRAVPATPLVLAAVAARATMAPEAGARALIPYIYAAATPRERVEQDVAVRLRDYPAPAGYTAQLKGVVGWESLSRLGGLRAPTLVLHGVEDQLIPPANGRLLAEAVAGARLELLAQASHIFWTDQPERTVATVLEFLREIEGGGDERAP